MSPTVRHLALAAQQHDFFVFSLEATLTSTIHASPSFCAPRSFRGRLFRLYIGNHRCFDSLFACSCSSVQLHTFCARVFFFPPPSEEDNWHIVDVIMWNYAFYSPFLRKPLPAALAIVRVMTYLWLNGNLLLVRMASGKSVWKICKKYVLELQEINRKLVLYNILLLLKGKRKLQLGFFKIAHQFWFTSYYLCKRYPPRQSFRIFAEKSINSKCKKCIAEKKGHVLRMNGYDVRVSRLSNSSNTTDKCIVTFKYASLCYLRDTRKRF